MICRTYLFVVLYYDLRFVSHRILNLYIQQDALILSPSACVCVPYRSAEQHGILEDDGESRPERLQRKLTDVDPIDDDLPCR